MLSRKNNLGRYGVWQFFALNRLLRLLLRVMEAVGLVSEDWDDATRGTLRGGSSLSIYMSINETYLSSK